MTTCPADLDRSRGVRAIALLYPGMWAQPRYAHLPIDVGAYLITNPKETTAMTDETPIVVNQDDDYDEDDHDPETCDEIDCYYAPTFEVEITRTVRYKIHAHTEDAAMNFVWANDVFIVSEPDGVEDFEDDSDDVSCRSEQEIMAEAARVRQTLAEMEAAEAAAAAAANPHADHDVWPLISKPGYVWCRTCQVEYTTDPVAVDA